MATGPQPSRIEGRQVLIGLQKRRADGRAKRKNIQSRTLPQVRQHDLAHRVGLGAVKIEGVEQLEHHLGQLRDSLFAQPRHGDASMIVLVRAALVHAAPTF
jgi:hypothetical protein